MENYISTLNSLQLPLSRKLFREYDGEKSIGITTWDEARLIRLVKELQEDFYTALIDFTYRVDHKDTSYWSGPHADIYNEQHEYSFTYTLTYTEFK